MKASKPAAKKVVAKKPAMAKGGAVKGKAPAKGKAKPKKYADGGDVMSQQSLPAVGGSDRPQKQPPMQQGLPMGFGAGAPSRSEQRMQNVGQKMQSAVQAMPAYQQMQQLGSSFSQTNQPTPAQIAQMQQYDQQIRSNPQVAKLQGKLQNMQQRQMMRGFGEQEQPRQMPQQTQAMPRQTMLTSGTAVPGARVAQQATPQQVAQLRAGEPAMAKGGMVKKKAAAKPAAKPMKKMAKGGAVTKASAKKGKK